MAIPGIYPQFQHWCKNTVWLYSDPHFGDSDLAKSIKRRPSDAEQIAKINSRVGRKDTLVVLGDVGDVECVRQLRGYKVLVMGNHDVGRSNYERKIVDEIYDQDSWTRDAVIADMQAKYPNWQVWVTEDYAFHSPFMRWVAHADNRLFDEVYEGALIIGEKIILTHEPVDIPWLWNFHGHDHSGAFRANHTNVCSDACGYEPLHLNSFIGKFGISSKITSIHRMTIETAIQDKKARGGKKIGEKKKKCSNCAHGTPPLTAGGVKAKSYCSEVHNYVPHDHYCKKWEEAEYCG